MKSEMSPAFRSFLAALSPVAMTMLLAASFVGSTQSVKWLGNSTLIAPVTTA